MTEQTSNDQLLSLKKEINKGYEPDGFDKALEEKVPGLYCEGARHLASMDLKTCFCVIHGDEFQKMKFTNWISLGQSICSRTGRSVILGGDTNTVLSIESFADMNPMIFVILYQFNPQTLKFERESKPEDASTKLSEYLRDAGFTSPPADHKFQDQADEALDAISTSKDAPGAAVSPCKTCGGAENFEVNYRGIWEKCPSCKGTGKERK